MTHFSFLAQTTLLGFVDDNNATVRQGGLTAQLISTQIKWQYSKFE